MGRPNFRDEETQRKPFTRGNKARGKGSLKGGTDHEKNRSQNTGKVIEKEGRHELEKEKGTANLKKRTRKGKKKQPFFEKRT